MRQNHLGGLTQFPGSAAGSAAGRLPEADRYAHGGNIWKLAERAGVRPEELIDFSANINPLGPPTWLPEAVADALAQVQHYPDPEAADLTLAACELYKVWPTQAVAGNGASELLPAICQLAARQGLARAVIPVPAYVDQDRCCRLAGLEVEPLLCLAQKGFAPDLEALAAKLDRPALVLLTSPGNPTGACVPARHVRDLARAFPQSLFVVDESFADFVPGIDNEAGDEAAGGAAGAGRLVRQRPDNVIVLVSMTKFYAVPGLRLGLCFASPENAARLRRRLPPWNVSILAQKVGARCLRDVDYRSRTIAEVARLREALTAELREIPGLRVFPGQANFLLCRLDRVGMSAQPLFERLLSEGLAIRLCKNFEGLDDSYFRIAVRTGEQNAKLVDALARFSGIVKAQPPVMTRRVPAIMVQGTCSNAGKSVLAAGICRILLEDGFDVAPFKAQNMSNNSAVTPDTGDGGREIGRAQATQAQACRLTPDPRMNPVLLKPTGDTGSQVLIHGKPVGLMNVREYHAYKPQAWAAVTQAYDSLAAEHQVMVLEGAGSPAEVNLKDQDIVNMKMALHAGAKVLLVGDIDRGGVFAALSGTYDILDEAERATVIGHVLNKFRGDASILGPALDFLYRRTGKPVLGVVPWLPELTGGALPEEDSVGLGNTGSTRRAKRPDALDIAVVVPARIANFNDLDPLAAEPDVALRLVRDVRDLGAPDAVILPGSKNTIDDMRALRGAGLAAALRALPEATSVIGICAGLQMLGTRVDDPLGLESGQKSADGFGLLPLSTELKRDKTLTRVSLAHPASGHAISGYEIHHGETVLENAAAIPLFTDATGRALAWGLAPQGDDADFPRVWGTYLHGVFDEDAFRRQFVDSLRQRKGLAPLGEPQTRFGLEPALERLADFLRQHLDMGRVYQALGLQKPGGLLG
ncbi:MAG TPA: cobyric acid synthase [Humidesulfovibrio sp.]|uniref:cobyric acid synthase n=1 Tax=Humidesulfovibrio sp. TaxID=2910988 RepID=UPI002CC08191|nr:cobyric acid synthase [Humidesulfovibrio sp.]HWR03569.1 cobyric acid synthase [Humidesulfovibrio sp.]